MLKKIISVALMLALALSLASCMGGGTAKLDEVSKDPVVSIESYLEEANVYFSLAPDMNKAIKGATYATVLEAYINAAKEEKELPAELIESYVNSAKEQLEESADDKVLDKAAKNLIKAELVIHLAYNSLDLGEITDTMRTEMAQEIARELDCDAAAIFTPGNSTYLVDSAIKEDLLKEYLLEALITANGGTITETSEVVEDESETDVTVDPEASAVTESSESTAA